MTEAYKVGVTVAMNNMLMPELKKIGMAFMSLDKQAAGLGVTLGTLGRVAGGAAVVGAIALLAAGVNEARKFQLEATKFAALGFGDAVNFQAQKFASGLQTMGTSATENMALVGDAMAVFKDLGHAQMAAPIMAQMKFANSAIYGAQGGGRDSKFMDMMKVIEMRGGLKSNPEFSEQAEFIEKVINGSRNRVDATQLLSALKTGGVALSQMKNEAFYLGSEPLIQEFGGLRFGTGMMSAYQNLVMARGAMSSQSELFRLGLLDPDKVKLNATTGKVKSVMPGAFSGASILEQEGPLAVIEKVLLPAFKAKGITSDDQIIQEIGRIFSNRTASSLFARAYQQRASLHTQSEANRSALGVSGMANAADKTLDGKMLELNKQWASLMKDLGENILPIAVATLKQLNNALYVLTNFKSIFIAQPAQFIDKHFSQPAADWLIDTRLGRKLSEGDLSSGRKAAFYNVASDWLKGDNRIDATPPAQNSQPIQVHTTINLDGKKVAQNTATHWDKVYSRAPSAGSAFDSRMSFSPVN